MPRTVQEVPEDDYIVSIRECDSITRSPDYLIRDDPEKPFKIKYIFAIHKQNKSVMIQIIETTGNSTPYKSMIPLDAMMSCIEKKIIELSEEELSAKQFFLDFEYGGTNSFNWAIYGAILRDLGILEPVDKVSLTNKKNKYLGWGNVNNLIQEIMEEYHSN